MVIDGARQQLVVTRSGNRTATFPATVPTSLKSGTYSVLTTSLQRYTNLSGAPSSSQRSLRISNGGTFIQASVSGTAESVNLSASDARSLFASTTVGDPVTVINAGSALTSADDDSNDWAYSWAQWQELSGS